MKTTTKVSLVNTLGEIVKFGMILITSVGIATMKKTTTDYIIEKDRRDIKNQIESEKKFYKNHFNRKK